MASSSSITSIFTPKTGLCTEWAIDRRPLQNAVFNVIGKTDKKADGLLPSLVDIVVEYLQVCAEKRGAIFRAADWSTCFEGAVVPLEPELPPDIEAIWQGRCRLFEGETVSNTHTFGYIPETVNGEPFNLRRFAILAEKYFPKVSSCNTACSVYSIESNIPSEIEDKPIGRGRWVLMTIKGITGTIGKPIGEQRAIVADFARKASAPYEIPELLEVAFCIVTQLATSKIRLFNGTFTHCQESVKINSHSLINSFELRPLKIGFYSSRTYLDIFASDEVQGLCRYGSRQKWSSNKDCFVVGLRRFLR